MVYACSGIIAAATRYARTPGKNAVKIVPNTAISLISVGSTS